MIRKVRGLIVFIVLGTSAWTLRAQGLPPAPVPVVPGSAPAASASPAQTQSVAQPNTLSPTATQPAQPLPGPTLSGPPPLLGPPPPGPPQFYPPYEDRNGPLLRGDPLLDGPDSQRPGWFAGLEVEIVGPHIKNRLQAPVDIDGTTIDPLRLPGADLDWTGAPRLELGYRLDRGLGEFVFSYRFLGTEGQQTLRDFDLDGSDGFLKSRLDVNVLDFDYASREWSLAPQWEMKWRAGVRLANIFFDSHAFGVFIEELESNDFFGAGPHVGLDLRHEFDVPGLSVFTRVEGATVFGRIKQRFDALVADDNGDLISGQTTVRKTQTVPTLSVQAGLSWTRCWVDHWSRYSVGYQFEDWWYLGSAGNSRAELMAHGVFLRGEFGF